MVQFYAALTGDLVNSSAAPEAEIKRAMDIISDSILSADPNNRFSRHRGDGWQAFVAKGSEGLGIALYLIAALRAAQALPSRIAIGIGDAFETDSPNLSLANGSAFVASGRALDAMPKDVTLGISQGPKTDPLYHSLMRFAQARADRWSVEQAQAVALTLGQGLTQAEIAQQLGVKRQAVTQRLANADMHLFKSAVEDFRLRFGEFAA